MGSLGPEISFSAPTEIISAQGILFDFDGKYASVEDSTPAADRF